MPKPLFGKFLVDANHIQTDQLLECLIEQVSKLPSIAELIYKNELLPKEKLLEVLELQVRDRLDFRQACTSLGVWSAEMEEKISSAARDYRIPIGELLVQKKYVEENVLVQALDEFLSLPDDEPKVDEKPEEPVVETKTEDVSKSEDQATQSDSKIDITLPESKDILSSSASDFEMVFTADLKSEYLKSLEEAELKNMVNGSLDILHTVKGVCSFVGAQVSEFFINEVENILRNKSNLEEIDGALGGAKAYLSSVFDVLWDIRECIVQGKNESSYLEDSSKKDVLLNLISKSREVGASLNLEQAA